MYACASNLEEVVDFLLESKAKVQVTDEVSFWSLSVSFCIALSFPLLTLFLFQSGWTPLHIASSNCLESIVSKLLKAGADPKAASGQKITPLHSAALRGTMS
jgi:ankyrin repeat protein